MRHTLKQQRGLTFLSIAIILGLIAFFVLLILKVGPIYLNHSKVVNALTALENTTDITSKSKKDLQDVLSKRFDTNYVDYVTPKDVEIISQPGYVKVTLDYERVEKIFGNLSVLVEFHEGFEKGNQ